AMRLGAVDFIEKPFNTSQLLARIAEAVTKDVESRKLDSEVSDLLKRLRVLGPREWQVASLVAAGKSSPYIAAGFDIKIKTVETHRHNILKKLQAESSAEVATLYTKAKSFKEQGMIDFPE